MARLPHIDRRRLLIGGGAGIGLVVGYALWPRRYPPTLTAAPGEHVFGGFVKIGEDGHVTVAVPQLEYGQGSWTALPQIVADELGADWRTVAVEPAPLSPLYANPLAWRALFEGALDRALTPQRIALMATVGSSSVRQFAAPLAEAGALARALLCIAAEAVTDVPWRQCRTEGGFVLAGNRRVRFGDLAAAAATLDPPAAVPRRGEEPGRLLGGGQCRSPKGVGRPPGQGQALLGRDEGGDENAAPPIGLGLGAGHLGLGTGDAALVPIVEGQRDGGARDEGRLVAVAEAAHVPGDGHVRHGGRALEGQVRPLLGDRRLQPGQLGTTRETSQRVRWNRAAGIGTDLVEPSLARGEFDPGHPDEHGKVG